MSVDACWSHASGRFPSAEKWFITMTMRHAQSNRRIRKLFSPSHALRRRCVSDFKRFETLTYFQILILSSGRWPPPPVSSHKKQETPESMFVIDAGVVGRTDISRFSSSFRNFSYRISSPCSSFSAFRYFILSFSLIYTVALSHWSFLFFISISYPFLFHINPIF